MNLRKTSYHDPPVDGTARLYLVRLVDERLWWNQACRAYLTSTGVFTDGFDPIGGAAIYCPSNWIPCQI